MTLRVLISPTGETATVSGSHHTTQIIGLGDAASWVRFYERLAKGKSGRFYKASLDAFRQALRDMQAAQDRGRV